MRKFIYISVLSLGLTVPMGQALAEGVQKHGMGQTGMMQEQQGASAGPVLRLEQDTVRSIQQALSDSGFDTEVDGLWGRQTVASVRDFQQDRGIEPTGQLNIRTLQALGVDITASGPAGQGGMEDQQSQTY